MNLISVIIPVYNVERYVAVCIESVLHQTYDMLEIILIDDGSSDSSLQICRKFAERDERVRVYHTENRGVSAARNLGIDLAQGDFVVFVDADDVIEKDMLGCMLGAYEKDRIVIGRYDTFEVDVPKDDRDMVLKVYRYDKDQFWELCEQKVIFSPCNKLYTREMLGKSVRFEEKMSMGEDIMFNLVCFKYISGFQFLDKVVYHYRCCNDQGSLGHKYREDAWEIQIRLYSELKRYSETEIHMDKARWDVFWWEYFKALQGVLDSEYAHENRKGSPRIVERMKSNEFEEVCGYLYAHKSRYGIQKRLEIVLYKHNQWKLDYWLRILTRKWRMKTF